MPRPVHGGARYRHRERRAATIKNALDFSETNLSWVINAYTLTFGGLLLLGGRAADLVGRRRMFMPASLLFSGASRPAGSPLGGDADHRRAVQGVGAAMVSPAALAIL